ncbi:RICIN domain-containing protein [Nonomuraea sp. NPDC050663]|uniref:RICIN domain-containing protein n=1 Tax=Nonomuraea sp. NPDC050663 TaxID=3364370 RepID=UPI00378DEA43
MLPRVAGVVVLLAALAYWQLDLREGEPVRRAGAVLSGYLQGEFAAGGVFSKGPGGLDARDRVLDVAEWGTDDGSRVHLWSFRVPGGMDHPSGVENQRWKVRQAEGSTVSLENVLAAGKCLDAADGAVVINACSAASTQRWVLAPREDGWLSLRNLAAGRCLEVTPGEWGNGVAPRLARCGYAWQQAWL